MRPYSAQFSGVNISAVQDVFELLVPSDSVIVITRIELHDETLEVSESGLLLLKRGTGAVTSGSSGSSVTPGGLHTGIVASGVTAERNNTTQASGGTITTVKPLAFNWLNGLVYEPLPFREYEFSPGEYALISLSAAPGQTRQCSGLVEWMEYGG